MGNPTETFEQSIGLIKGTHDNFEPSEENQDCNTNYLLINRIMVNVLRYKNFQYIQEKILIPLKHTNIFSDFKEVKL